LAYTAAAAGFEARVCFETDDYTMAQTLVAAGIGIALIPDLATANLLDGVVLRPLSRGLPTRRVALIWRRSAESAACRAMLEVLRGYQRPTVAAA
jgi:DNA-binding transcriptional LysR family regulator